MQTLYSERKSEQEESVDLDEPKKITPLFIGGVPDIVKSICGNFNNSRHTQDAKSGKIDIIGIDCIVMFFEYMNHALYYKIINVARANNIPVIYVRGTNQDNILHTIFVKNKL